MRRRDCWCDVLHDAGSPTAVGAWHAELNLGFERRGESSVLAHRSHHGPLRIQKALYPEGPGICHAIVLHPPAGIVGGDQLRIAIDVDAGAHAVLTTPGAGKWYRSSGASASQQVALKVSRGGTAEWLPQESIVFSGARARMSTRVDLEEGARFVGVETLCFGRRASGERFDRGELALRTEIDFAGKPLWRERGRIAGNSPVLTSPMGLAGFSVCSTVLAAGVDIDSPTLAACRAVTAAEPEAQHSVTALPKLVIGRYLGHSAEAARLWFVDLWTQLRPALVGHDANPPRIWAT